MTVFTTEGQQRVVLTAALEYNNLFMTASTTEGHPRAVLKAVLRKITTFHDSLHHRGTTQGSSHRYPEEYNNPVHQSLHHRGTAQVNVHSCPEEYDKQFIAASITERQHMVVLTAALRNIITLLSQSPLQRDSTGQ